MADDADAAELSTVDVRVAGEVEAGVPLWRLRDGSDAAPGQPTEQTALVELALRCRLNSARSHLRLGELEVRASRHGLGLGLGLAHGLGLGSGLGLGLGLANPTPLTLTHLPG